MSCPYKIKITNPNYKGSSLSLPIYQRTRYYFVGCGRCLQCQTQKNKWLSFASGYEYNKHGIASFTTLTYDDINVPINKEKTRLTLNYKDFQDFMKRLRQRIYRETGVRADISYICAGQYGEQGERPHYHVIIFGVDARVHDKIITECWNKGGVKNLPLKSGGIDYVIRYQNRDINRNKQKYNIDKIERPFVIHSIGYGKGYILENMDFIIKHNGMYKGEKNRLYPIPSYYMRLLRLYRPIDYEPIKQEMEQMKIPKNKDGIYTKAMIENYNYQKSRQKEELLIRQSREKKSPQEDFDGLSFENNKNNWLI